MRLVPVHRVTDGMKLARDVLTGRPGELPLLRAGVQLSTRFASRLEEKGVHAIWVEDQLGEFIVPVEPLTPEVQAQALQATGAALESAREALAMGQALSERVLEQVSSTAAAVAECIAACPEAALALDDLAAADTYTHRHSVRVTTLGLLIANRLLRQDGWVDWEGKRRFDRIEERLTTLGTGLLLHDVGKLSIPAEILTKPDALTPDEFELVKLHPQAGESLLPLDRVGPLVRAVVRSHHERWDGQGYPDGRSGDSIHQFARIAAVADVYDAVTSDRPYKRAAPPHVGVRAVIDGCGSQFDAAIIDHFRRVVMPYPLGHEVELPDGRLGVVSDIDIATPERPTVRVHRADGTIEELAVDMSAAAAA